MYSGMNDNGENSDYAVNPPKKLKEDSVCKLINMNTAAAPDSKNFRYIMDNDWRLLPEFEYPDVPKDFICILCKKLLYDARISACGCRFCAGCIKNYLENENITCPGQSEECQDVILNLPGNISKDPVMNRKISKIKITCPISGCLYNDDLINVVNHLKECSERAIRCLYFEQGCNYVSSTQDDIDEHLQKVDHIGVMVSEIKNLKQNVEALKSIKTNKQTAEELEDLRMKFNELENEMNDMKSTLTTTWNSLATPFTWKCTKKDLTYQHSDQFLLYGNGPLVVLRSYLQDRYFEVTVFMVKGDSNRKKPFPVTCIISLEIYNYSNRVKDETIKIFSSDTDVHKFNFIRTADLNSIIRYNEFDMKVSVTVIE